MLSHFDLFAMSCLRSASTGVPGTILWVSVGEPTTSEDLGPRLWVVLGDSLSPEHLENAVIVRLTSPREGLGPLSPDIAGHVVRFIEMNTAILLRYWNAEISTREMLDRMERT